MSAASVQITNAAVSTAPPRWKTLYFNIRDFRNLPTSRNHYVKTPEFSCNGHDWRLEIYPGGSDDADEGNVSIFLNHRSEGSITASYELMIIDKFGKRKKAFESNNRTFEGNGQGYGRPNFIERSNILGESKNILDSDGTLTVAVSIKEEPSDVFVPNNPFQKIVLQDIFLDEDTADVCFEVSSAATTFIFGTVKKEVKPSDIFHAHSQILKNCAPMLADLFDLDDIDGKLAMATIADIKPDIFRHLLRYVYGGIVPETELKKHAKDIIDAADKYSIVNLKLEAEAAYVKSTNLAMENVMEDLLYADAKNCPLLKEAAMNFLAENSTEAYEKVSFKDVPGYLMKDLILAVSNSSKKDASGTSADELSTLSVNALRRKLDEMDLSVDGSREAMIESIRNNS